MRSEKPHQYADLRLLEGAVDAALLATMPGDEAALLDRAQNADTRDANQSLLCLLEFYELDVISYAVRIFRDTRRPQPRDDARDAWADTIFRITRRLHRQPQLFIHPNSTFLAILYTIARNAANDILSESATHHTQSLDRLLQQLPNALAGHVSMHDMFDGAAENDLLEAINAGPISVIDRDGRSPVMWAIRALPLDHRRCFVLHDYFGFPFSIIGALLGIPEGTAGFKAWAARDHVRALLAYCWRFEHGYSMPQIADNLRVPEAVVPRLLEEGVRQTELLHKREMRGERDD